MENEGILYVFPIFHTEGWGQKIRCPAEDDLFRGSLILYEGPKPVAASTVATMKVDGNELFVYDTAVNNTHSWVSNYKPSLTKAPVTSFDFEGAPVTMEITVTDQTELGDVVVRPLAKGIVPTVEGNVISFTVAEPDVYTVEYGGSAMNAMQFSPTPSTMTLQRKARTR